MDTDAKYGGSPNGAARRRRHEGCGSPRGLAGTPSAAPSTRSLTSPLWKRPQRFSALTAQSLAALLPLTSPPHPTQPGFRAGSQHFVQVSASLGGEAKGDFSLRNAASVSLRSDPARNSRSRSGRENEARGAGGAAGPGGTAVRPRCPPAHLAERPFPWENSAELQPRSYRRSQRRQRGARSAPRHAVLFSVLWTNGQLTSV